MVILKYYQQYKHLKLFPILDPDLQLLTSIMRIFCLSIMERSGNTERKLHYEENWKSLYQLKV